MSVLEIILPFAGGLGMFIYGMQLMAQGLENTAGTRLQSFLEKLTTRKVTGVLFGAFITAVIQSSSATTVMVVGFVNASVMKLSQAMNVIMGANIGTTITAWIVSAGEWTEFLKPSKIAPIAMIVGVILLLVAKRKTSKDVSSIIIGFALLFIGISLMSTAVEPLKDSESFKSLFVSMGNNPFLGIIAGMLVTAIIQSSSASVGILQSLAIVGLVPFDAAVYIIMGQNIGTCITAILSSIGTNKNAKAAACMHLLFNIIGSIIFSCVAIIFFKFINTSLGATTISQTQISVVHTLFNIATTLLLFPFSSILIRIAKKVVRVDETATDIGVAAIDDRMLETPSLALQISHKEIVRMGDIVKDGLTVTSKVLIDPTIENISKIKELENVTDRLCGSLTDYIIKISTLPISAKEHEQVASYLQILTDMERISDYAENIAEFAEIIRDKKLKFSDIAMEQLDEVFETTIKCYDASLDALKTNDKKKAEETIEIETKIDDLEVKFRNLHIKRLAKNECNTEAGIIFLDTLVSVERISDHARNIAEEVLEN